MKPLADDNSGPRGGSFWGPHEGRGPDANSKLLVLSILRVPASSATSRTHLKGNKIVNDFFLNNQIMAVLLNI